MKNALIFGRPTSALRTKILLRAYAFFQSVGVGFMRASRKLEPENSVHVGRDFFEAIHFAATDFGGAPAAEIDFE